MKRLISAIRRAQRDGEELRQRQAAEQTTARFAALLESTPDFIGMADLEGRMFLCQPRRAEDGGPSPGS